MTNTTDFPTPTTHGDWHIIDGKLVDLSKQQPDVKADATKKPTQAKDAATVKPSSKEQ